MSSARRVPLEGIGRKKTRPSNGRRSNDLGSELSSDRSGDRRSERTARSRRSSESPSWQVRLAARLSAWNPGGVRLRRLVLGLVAVVLAGLSVNLVRRGRARSAAGSALATDRDALVRGGISRVHFYTAPKPFVGADADNQIRALRSWLALRPQPKITFLGDGEGYDEVATRFGLEIDRGIDTSFRGLPLFSSMVDRVNASSAAVAVLLNSDIIVFDDLAIAINKVRGMFDNFLMVAARWDVDSVANASHVEFGDKRYHIINEARDSGQLHTDGGIDLWAWNTRGSPLFRGAMPHFVYGRGKYDNWFTHEAVAAGFRDVIDVSEAVTLVHVRHDHHLVADVVAAEDKTGFQRGYWSVGVRSKFELSVNNYLAKTFGSYENQMGTIMHSPYKLMSCYERVPMCLFRRERPHSCRCEYSPFVPGTHNDPFVVPHSRVIFCGQAPTGDDEEASDTTARTADGSDPALAKALAGYPPRDSLVEMVVSNNVVVSTALNNNDRPRLDVFVCNMRRLGAHNLLVGALDEQLYEHGALRGLAIYLADVAFTEDEGRRAASADRSSPDMHLLRQARLRVLRGLLAKGVDVLHSDVDVLWLRDPFPVLADTPGDFVVLSAAEGVEPANAGLSLAFVLVRSGTRAEAALDRALAALGKAEQSEQSDAHAVYGVLCGEQGEFRDGEFRCMRDDLGVSSSFLRTDLFVNDAGRPGLWKKDGRSKQGPYVAHNPRLADVPGRAAHSVHPGTGLCVYD